jgi:tRNA A37 threonylcarbamoyladenosine synthetase subunit TsaC/SUA5/YrdC
VPDHPVILGLLAEHGEPVLGTSLILPGEDEPISDPDDAIKKLAKRVDLVVDAGSQGFEPTTVIDMTGDAPQVTRVGRGPIDRMTGASAGA